MKRSIILLLIIKLSLCFTYAQSNTLEGFASFSAPSAAAIPNIVNSPVSPATGIPEIAFSFFSLPTYAKNIAATAGMIYHPGNSNKHSGVTDIGLGWSLYGLSGTIYREVNGNDPDSEILGGDDIFYYNFLGKTGKFILKYTSDTEPPIIQKITLDKLEIKYSDQLGALTFTIIDESGNSFLFNIPDRSYWQDTDKQFTNAYYLSKIKTVSNIEILNFEYLEDNYTITTSTYPYSKSIKSLKLNKVNSPGFGSIILTYIHDAQLRKSHNDPYQLTNIELRDIQNKTVSRYDFEQEFQGFTYYYNATTSTNACGNFFLQNKRILKKLIKYDLQNGMEATRFYYQNEVLNSSWADAPCGCFNDEESNSKYLGYGLLNKIIYPAGLEVRYQYEINQYYVNKNTPTYLENNAPPYEIRDREAQYYEDLATVNFDTHNSNLYFFNVPNDMQDSYLVFCTNINTYYPPCENPDSPFDCSTPPFINVITGGTTMSNGYTKFSPGKNGFEVRGTGGNGSLTVKRIRYHTLPLQNYSTGNGIRIKSIDYYENNVWIERLSKKYYYNKFNENITSGILSTIDDGSVVIYKNVKEIIGKDNGYTQYYFKTLWDYPENLNSDGSLKYNSYKFYNILNTGLLEKVEVYNNSQNLISSESNSYEFYELPGSHALGKNAMIKKHTITSTEYTANGNIVQIKENTRDIRDFNIINKKTIDAEGTIIEENVTYPWGYQLTDPRLWNAHLINVPLISEFKRNGKLISKNEIKYIDTSHFYPTSSVSTNPNDNTLKTSVKYDIYDDKGNLVQFTTLIDDQHGLTTTIIWGYNHTYPIAVIEGVKLSDIENLTADIITKSNLDKDDQSEKTLLQALDSFRSNAFLKDYKVTTYTYNPLVGITSTTGPNGMREIYKYDKYNRMQYILDVNGNILKEYQYNTKPQL